MNIFELVKNWQPCNLQESTVTEKYARITLANSYEFFEGTHAECAEEIAIVNELLVKDLQNYIHKMLLPKCANCEEPIPVSLAESGLSTHSDKDVCIMNLKRKVK